MRDWNYQTYWHNDTYLLMLECNSRTGETLVSFPDSCKYRFMHPELHQIGTAVLERGESLCGLLDWLLENGQLPNGWDTGRFHEHVALAMERWLVPETGGG